jgi:hypothetical protein
LIYFSVTLSLHKIKKSFVLLFPFSFCSVSSFSSKTERKHSTISKKHRKETTMKFAFTLLALVAFVAMSQQGVDARPNHLPHRNNQRRLVDELLVRRLYEIPINTLLPPSSGGSGVTGKNYRVKMKKINVQGGWDPMCGGPPTALVYSPDAPGRFPLLSFAHGMTAGGDKVDRSYSRLLRQVAGTGYVIIATQDAPTAFCANMYKDQLKSIDVAKRFPNVDASKGFGIFGHSMGGQSTVNSAGSRSHDIRAAVALHPATFGGGTVKVPILYATGSSDRMTGCSPRAVEGLYDRTSLSNMNRPGIFNPGKVFANIRGAGHTEPNFGSKWNRYVIAMFDCHIKRSPSSCGIIYGRGRDSLCHGSLSMAKCITAGGGRAAFDIDDDLLDSYDDDLEEEEENVGVGFGPSVSFPIAAVGIGGKGNSIEYRDSRVWTTEGIKMINGGGDSFIEKRWCKKDGHCCKIGNRCRECCGGESNAHSTGLKPRCPVFHASCGRKRRL